MNRRYFLKFLASVPVASYALQSPAMWRESKNNYLIMLELKGGNDSLNTFIPRSDPIYYSQRPNIAITKDKAIKITTNLGFHPSLPDLAIMYDEKDMALFNNVGYPSPNKSHFTSLAIVEKGISGDSGWAYEVMKNYDRDLDGIVFSGSGGLFDAETPNFIKVKNIKKFVKQSRWLRVNKHSNNHQVIRYNHTKLLIKKSAKILESGALNTQTYTPNDPESKLATQFSQIAKIIKSNTNMPILKLHLPGFDTHADQLSVQSDLLLDLNDSLMEFTNYLKSEGLWNNSLIYAFSEFGRRIAENGNGGTDHGEAYTGFALGGMVSGGSYGEPVDLSEKNIKYQIDHRQLLHAIEKRWLKVGKPTNIVRAFQEIDFLSHS